MVIYIHLQLEFPHLHNKCLGGGAGMVFKLYLPRKHIVLPQLFVADQYAEQDL